MSDGSKDSTAELQLQVAELQSQLAFQEDSLASLDEALASQQAEILLLRRHVELLQERQREFEVRHDGGETAARVVDEKPPHY